MHSQEKPLFPQRLAKLTDVPRFQQHACEVRATVKFIAVSKAFGGHDDSNHITLLLARCDRSLGWCSKDVSCATWRGHSHKTSSRIGRSDE